MTDSTNFSRRGFLTAATCGAVALGAMPIHAAVAETAPKEKDPFCGLKVGVASYSLRNFKGIDNAIKMTNELGVKYLALKSFHLPMNASKAECEEAAAKVKAAGINLMGCGVVGMKKEADVNQAFEYAKNAGMPVIIASPSLEMLPLINKKIKEYDIKVAIHNHGPGDKVFPSPSDVYKHVAPFDKRLGLCIDVGHTGRWGDDEVAMILKTKDRLHDLHIKDITKREASGSTTEVGRGVLNIPGILQALIDIKFKGHVALEFEKNASNPMPGMAESFTYIRGVLAGMNA